jgi:hypothetical protein
MDEALVEREPRGGGHVARQTSFWPKGLATSYVDRSAHWAPPNHTAASKTCGNARWLGRLSGQAIGLRAGRRIGDDVGMQ